MNSLFIPCSYLLHTWSIFFIARRTRLTSYRHFYANKRRELIVLLLPHRPKHIRCRPSDSGAPTTTTTSALSHPHSYQGQGRDRDNPPSVSCSWSSGIIASSSSCADMRKVADQKVRSRVLAEGTSFSAFAFEFELIRQLSFSPIKRDQEQEQG